ncbi:MAG TPA: hypothetical protein VH207_10520 [Chthoniobacterales bacterium]|nr:hypothetical protein [Chthoniobacterales bacterium]
MRRLWKLHRGEFFVALTALLGVLWAGLLRGVLIGAVISLVLLIRRVSSPHVAFLGRIPGTRRYSDVSRHADNEPVAEILAVRVEAGIIYFNAIMSWIQFSLASLPHAAAATCHLRSLHLGER